MLCTVVLFKMKRDRYAWVSDLPDGVAAHQRDDGGLVEDLRRDPGHRLPGPGAQVPGRHPAGELIAPARHMGQMQQVMVNNFINAALTAVFLAVVLSVLVYSVQAVRAACREGVRTDRETAYVALNPQEVHL
jgi:carbon starvation protein